MKTREQKRTRRERKARAENKRLRYARRWPWMSWWERGPKEQA